MVESSRHHVVALRNASDLLEYCLDLGRSLGASYVEARFEHKASRGLVYRNGEPVSGGMSPLAGIGVRLLVDGNFGFAAFDRLERDLAEEAVTAAYRMAKNSRRPRPIDLGEPVANKAKWTVDVRQSLAGVDIETLMQTADEMNQQMQGLAQYTLMLNPTVADKHIMTTEGTDIQGHLEHIFMFVLLTAKGKTGSEQRFLDITQCGGWERIKEGRVIEKLHEETVQLQRAANEAKAVKELMDGPVDVIVGPEVAGIIAHENVGHPSEGDRIMGREGAQAGESFWRDLKIGESRIGSEAVTVCEDPTIPNTGGFYLYDDEGVKARKRTLIKQGIANEPLLNREFGVVFGRQSNGAARSSAYNREPIIRMANTYFEPGDYSLEELFEDVRLGVFMKNFQEWNIDDRRYQSKYTGCESYMIKNGELTDTLIRRPVLETTSVGLLSSVDAVSKELRFDFPGTCGKSEPMQGVPVYAGGGHVRFRDIRLGGVG
ncbi:MAG: TldD/PmbA family protein [Candidatus Thorarchaeota archaeon]